jgi:hypothetical protein
MKRSNMTKLPVKTMMLFANGNIAAFDDKGNQIPELQEKSAIELWAEFAKRIGYKVEGCECRMQEPSGRGLQFTMSTKDNELVQVTDPM